MATERPTVPRLVKQAFRTLKTAAGGKACKRNRSDQRLHQPCLSGHAAFIHRLGKTNVAIRRVDMALMVFDI